MYAWPWLMGFWVGPNNYNNQTDRESGTNRTWILDDDDNKIFSKQKARDTYAL